MTDVLASFELRKKYRHFRILVIGRANAGKTTLLKRVCNTTDEPCIYDEKSNSLLEPTSERGIHDIDRPFAFASNPQFIFHDSPGFETGDERQLKEVQSFIEKRAKSTEVDDQLHAIWFCFIPNKARFLLDLEKRFFNEQQAGNAPVIAIFTKFDDLINQVYDTCLEEDENREAAATLLKDNLRGPLFEYQFPPRADVCLEDMHEDDSDHQEQVKELIKKTADSLDDLALKILFVSVQHNNLELCLKYAVKYAPDLNAIDMEKVVKNCLIWFRHSHYERYNYGKTENRTLGGAVNPLLLASASLGGGAVGRAAAATLRENCKKVTIIMNEMKFEKPPMAVFAALLICLENSFWYTTASSSFTDAFCKAFELYQQTGIQEVVKIALTGLPLNQGSSRNGHTFLFKYQDALLELLLKHRLPHPDNLKVTN